jgi:hypothetical protein
MQQKKKFQIQKLEPRIAPSITAITTKVNGGGNTPNGEANGVPSTTTYVNPTGFAPPGQN